MTMRAGRRDEFVDVDSTALTVDHVRNFIDPNGHSSAEGAVASGNGSVLICRALGDDTDAVNDFRKRARARAMVSRAGEQELILALLLRDAAGRRPGLLEEPLVACAACGAADNLSRCSRCEGALYCSVVCQRSAWRAHKPLCTALAAPRTPLLPH